MVYIRYLLEITFITRKTCNLNFRPKQIVVETFDPRWLLFFAPVISWNIYGDVCNQPTKEIQTLFGRCCVMWCKVIVFLAFLYTEPPLWQSNFNILFCGILFSSFTFNSLFRIQITKLWNSTIFTSLYFGCWLLFFNLLLFFKLPLRHSSNQCNVHYYGGNLLFFIMFFFCENW